MDVAMRAEDILTCARFLLDSAKEVELIALGRVGAPALHAAAIEPDMFKSVKPMRPVNRRLETHGKRNVSSPDNIVVIPIPFLK